MRSKYHVTQPISLLQSLLTHGVEMKRKAADSDDLVELGLAAESLHVKQSIDTAGTNRSRRRIDVWI